MQLDLPYTESQISSSTMRIKSNLAAKQTFDLLVPLRTHSKTLRAVTFLHLTDLQTIV